MRLALRDRSYDLATRALVLAVGSSCAEVDGADLLEGDVVELHSAAIDRALVDAAVAGRAAVVVTGPPDVPVAALCDHLVSCARTLEQAGMVADRIVLSAGPHRSPALLRATARFAALGYPLLVDLEPWPDDDVLGAASLAVASGARILRTRRVRAARRVADTIAAVLEAA